jgi:anti-sigma factor RsiW
MCEYSKCLIAWMDGELAKSEAAEVEQHVRACPACGKCVSACEEICREFAAYYAAFTQTRPVARRQKVSGWVPMAASVAAVAAMLVIAFMTRSAKQVPTIQQAAAIPSTVKTSPIPKTTAPASLLAAEDHYAPYRQQKAIRVGQPHRTTKLESTKAEWAIIEPAIEIAIPAEAMFPPGAVPEGVTYIANVSLGPDGLVRGLRLQP